MRPALFPLLLVSLGLAAACGHKIGDSCSVSSDCSSDGTRVCDTFSPGGQCTIEGCDFNTCPSEAVCVRFFPALDKQTAAPCADTGGNPDQTLCAPDEWCTIDSKCAPRSIELRFCMLSCDGNGDCRDNYECRDDVLMERHGGEPVPDPTADELLRPDTKFCAPRRTCSSVTDCDPGDVCNTRTRICDPQ
jgi:hypothetical protein